MAEDNLALTLDGPASAEVDFDAIHDAFMDTERGRWFLTEYARRNRHADTALLLAAIGRIESILLAQRAASSLTQQDVIAPANPQSIKPEETSESKSEAARLLAETADRLRAAIPPLRDVAWSLREQGDMRCEVLDRQAVEIARAIVTFDAVCAQPDAAAVETIATPPEPPQAEAVAPVVQPPVAREVETPIAQAFVPPPPRPEINDISAPSHADETPPPARTFATAPLLDSLPAQHQAPQETIPPQIPDEVAEPAPLDALLQDQEMEFTFQELFEPEPVEAAHPEIPAASSEIHSPAVELMATEPVAETEMVNALGDSAQAQRLTRLIHLFAGPNAPTASGQPQPAIEAPEIEVQVSAAVAESAHTDPAPVIFAEPELQQASPEPADFLLEPWPRVSTVPDEPVLMQAPPALEPAPVMLTPARAPTATNVHFPMQRAAPNDPLAPIVSLSVEEKIALFS